MAEAICQGLQGLLHMHHIRGCTKFSVLSTTLPVKLAPAGSAFGTALYGWVWQKSKI